MGNLVLMGGTAMLPGFKGALESGFLIRKIKSRLPSSNHTVIQRHQLPLTTIICGFQPKIHKFYPSTPNLHTPHTADSEPTNSLNIPLSPTRHPSVTHPPSIHQPLIAHPSPTHHPPIIHPSSTHHPPIIHPSPQVAC